MTMYLYSFKNAKGELVATVRHTDDTGARYAAGVSTRTSEVTMTKTAVAS